MALLQRYSCCNTTTSLASPVSFSLQPRRSVLQLQRAQKRKLRLSVCRASYGKGAGVAFPQKVAGQLFFKDESTGVVCYHDENGDVTCVGWEEGPHFQPDPQRPKLRRRRFTPRSPVQGRSDHEVTVQFENVKGRMGDSLIEVANESLECSEL